jgi:hypothetical protein
MVKKIYIYENNGDYAGFARLGTDDIGTPVAEVYDIDDDRLGAVRYEELQTAPLEGRVHRKDGQQVGYIRAKSGGDGVCESEVFHVDIAGELGSQRAYIRYSSGNEHADIFRDQEGRERMGSLKPENVTGEELVVVGGGAAMLLGV